jgi:anti-sigma regulatory factor (Ser/Thr protein kinase)
MGSAVVTVLSASGPRVPERFEHEVTFYAGTSDHARAVVPFIREGLVRDEPVLVALVPERIEAVQEVLGSDADRVDFVDMTELGANPARIIPRWRSFLADHGDGAPVRGVGEPAWPGRRDSELIEATLHESLLNLAFDSGPGWRLLCPYDVTALPAHVLDEALRTHPAVRDAASETVRYGGHALAASTFAAPLPPPPDVAERIGFGGGDLALLRSIVMRAAESSRLPRDGAEDLALAVHELATNSVLHGGGQGSLVVWDEPDALVVEVRDSGWITDPLVGRALPNLLQENGRGIWMANQLCDLVQVRSRDGGTQVRLRSWL